MTRKKKPKSQKRKPVDHRHPCVAAAIHVLKDAGGGPLPAVLIFRRAYDRGLLATTAYNTLRARLSQHQNVESVVVVRTDAGYMLAAEGVPRDVPEARCAPNRPPLPRVLQDDPLAIVATAPRRRRKQQVRVRDIRVTPEWLLENKAPDDVLKWTRLRRGDDYPTTRDLLTGWLPAGVSRWFVENLPLEPGLRAKLQAAETHGARMRILKGEEEPRRRRRRSAPVESESVEQQQQQEEPNGEAARR
jgi:hypothetical protein